MSAGMDGRPVVPSSSRLRPLGLAEVEITGGFWGRRQEVNSEATIGHCHEWMERLGWVGNFRAAAEGRLPEDRNGVVFTDSDVYKLMEAAAWEVGRSGSADADRRFTDLTAVIAPVQEEDGYLNTVFGRPGQPDRYSDLEWGHELYCYGHMLQAAVARARTGRADEFVEVAKRVADHVCNVFGDGGVERVGGHPEIELGLVELARVTGEERYLHQASLFIDRRGHQTLADIHWGRSYFQDDVPVRDQVAFTGHSVRALYLAASAVDVAVETGDEALLESIIGQWERTVARRTYLTGGMGSHHDGEKFGEDFVLPPDRAYSETCAGIASVMLSWRLLLATGETRFADLAERTLYNVVATSPAPDGRSFFYANPLHQRVPGVVPSPDFVSNRAASSLREPWFAVSCCPTNVARTFASLASYLATTDDSGLQIHQYADSRISTTFGKGRRVGVEVGTKYPAEGKISVRVNETDGSTWALTLRVPPWSSESWLVVGDERMKVGPGQVGRRAELRRRRRGRVGARHDATVDLARPAHRLGPRLCGCRAWPAGAMRRIGRPARGTVGGHDSGRSGIGSRGERRCDQCRRKSVGLRRPCLAGLRPRGVGELGRGDTPHPVSRLGQPRAFDHAGLDTCRVASLTTDRS